MKKTTRIHLAEERKRRQWSQQEVADQIGTTQNNVSRWEIGVTTPGPYFRAKLSTLFGKDTRELGLCESNAAPAGTDPGPEHNLVTLDQATHNPLVQDEVAQQLAMDHLPETTPVIAEDTSPVTTTPGSASRQPPLLEQVIVRRVAIGSLLGIVLGAGAAGASEHLWHRQDTLHPTLPGLTPLYIYHPHPSRHVNDVAWSPHGHFLSCAIGDNTVQILKADTGAVTLVYRGHTDYTNCAQWAPDEHAVASASTDRTVQVWRPDNGQRLLTYQGHTASVWYLAWSHDGTRLASGGKDATVQVWDVWSGRQISVYRGHQGGIWSVRWSPDDNSIVSGGIDGMLHVWDPFQAHPSPTFVYTGPRTTTINEVDWSPDGRQIASAHDDGRTYLWDALTGGMMVTYSGHTAAVRTARWSPNGKWMASGGADETVQIWNSLTGKRLLIDTSHTNDILELSWAPNGTYLASASKDLTMQVCRVQL